MAIINIKIPFLSVCNVIATVRPFQGGFFMQKYMIKTQRLGLRPFQQSDIDYLAELNSDPEVREFFPDGTQNREQTEARMNDFISYYKEQGLPCFVMFDL